MRPPPTKSLVFGAIDPVEPGQTYEHLGLHLTLVQPFAHPPALSVHVQTVVRTVLAAWGPLDLTAAGHAMFGPDHNIAVQRVTGPDLHRLHDQLLAALSACPNLLMDTTYGGPRYSPHITDCANRRIEDGQQLTIETVAVAHKSAGHWQIAATIPLHAPHD